MGRFGNCEYGLAAQPLNEISRLNITLNSLTDIPLPLGRCER